MSNNKAAAIALYQMAMTMDNHARAAFGGSPESRQRYVDALEEAAVVATERARLARLASSLRDAVDAVLPGWVDVDASDHLPQELWYAFISDDPDKWGAWLVEHGVSEDVARTLVDDAFGGGR